MDIFFYNLLQKIAALLVAPIVPICAMIGASGTVPVAPPQTAAVYAVAEIPPTDTVPVIIFSLPTMPEIAPGLLPKIKVAFRASPTSTMQKIKTGAAATVPTSTVAALPKKPPAQKPPSASVSAVQATSAPLAISTPALLASTTVSFKELRTGPYVMSFSADLGNGKNLPWDFGTQNIGGANTAIPQFAVSYSCDPLPDQPDPGAIDQRPTFQVKTTYHCAVSLTPFTGNDRRAQSKNFSFMTPAGQLIVTPASAISTVLADDANDGGIVFANQDAAAVTITGLTFDVSYQALTTLNGPLVLRILDPATGQSLFDYHMENMPQISSSTFSYAQSGVSAPLSFTLAPGSKKMLPLQVLGVHKMSMQGINPTVTISVRSVATDRSDVKTILNSPVVSWTCIVAIAGFDPYATNGPFATGQACH
jgi:hypothetical protein